MEELQPLWAADELADLSCAAHLIVPNATYRGKATALFHLLNEREERIRRPEDGVQMSAERLNSYWKFHKLSMLFVEMALDSSQVMAGECIVVVEAGGNEIWG